MNIIGPSQRAFENNIQHIGGQRQVSKSQTDEPQTETNNVLKQNTTDSVSFTQDASENAAQVGMLQDELDDEFDVQPQGEQSQETDSVAPGMAQGMPDDSENGTAEVGTQEPNYPIDPNSQVGDGTPTEGQGAVGEDAPNAEQGETEAAGNKPQAEGAAPKSQAEQAAEMQKMQQEREQIMTMLIKMAADRQKWMAEIWKIIRETQTKTYEIMQSALINKAQTFNKVNQMWDDVIRGKD